MTRLVIVLALASGLGMAPQAPQTTTPPKPTGAQATTPGARPGSIDLTVTSQTGAYLGDATVKAEGPTSRQGSTTGEGEVALTNVPAGTYRCRIERTGYVTLEKEVVVKAGTRTATDAVLTPAPPAAPPPAPAPTPAPVAPTLVAGPAVTVSLTDQLATDLLNSKDPVAEHALGCTGATSAKLIRLKDGLPSQKNADTDELIYMIAGDATLTINGKDQTVSAGWLGIVPRGASHAIARKGKNPLLLLSVQSGPACSANSAHGASGAQ